MGTVGESNYWILTELEFLTDIDPCDVWNREFTGISTDYEFESTRLKLLALFSLSSLKVHWRRSLVYFELATLSISSMTYFD